MTSTAEGGSLAAKAPPLSASTAQQEYDEHLTTVGRGAAINLVGSVVGSALGFLFSVALARLLPVATVGYYLLAWAIVDLLTIPASLGCDWGIWRFVPVYRARGDAAGVRGAVLTALLIAVPWSTLLAVALFALATPLAVLLYHKALLAVPLRWFAVALPFMVAGSIFVAVLQALQRLEYSIYSKKVGDRLLRVVLSSSLVRAGWGLAGALAGTVIAVIVTTGLAGLFVWRLLPRDRTDPAVRLNVSAMVRFSLPQTVSAGLFSLVTWTDIECRCSHRSSRACCSSSP